MNKKIILSMFFIAIFLPCSEVLGILVDYPPTSLAKPDLVEIELTTNKEVYNYCEIVHYYLTNHGEKKITVRGPAFSIYNADGELVDQFAIFACIDIEPGETKHIIYNHACYPDGFYYVIGQFLINGKTYYANTHYIVHRY